MAPGSGAYGSRAPFWASVFHHSSFYDRCHRYCSEMHHHFCMLHMHGTQEEFRKRVIKLESILHGLFITFVSRCLCLVRRDTTLKCRMSIVESVLRVQTVRQA